MRLRVPPKEKRLPHLWFAWRPVKVGLTWVWLEHVRRKKVSVPLRTCTAHEWHYALPENVLY